MAFEQTEAIVLRKVDFSETSRIVTFLTPLRGRMACIVKGARRKGSPMATILDTYNRLEITCVWKDSRQVQLLTEATLLDAYGTLKSNVECIACAAFLLETAGLAAQENNPAPEIYDAAREGLEQLTTNPANPFAHVARSVYATLAAAGFAPDAADISFMEQTRALSESERRELHQVITAYAAGESPSQLKYVSLAIPYLRDSVVHHFERPLKSYAFLETMLTDKG